MGVGPVIEASVSAAEQAYQAMLPPPAEPVVPLEPDTLWPKLDHLLYLSVLGLTRPRDLYYYQGQGLQVLYGFTYKYLTLEHFRHLARNNYPKNHPPA